LREDEGSQIVIAGSEMEATITKNQEQLKRGLPIAEFMPVEMPCRQFPMIWLRKIGA